MPRLHVPHDRLSGPTVELVGEAHRHLVRVLRLGPGASVLVFDGRGVEVDALVERVGARSVVLRLGARRQVVLPHTRLVLLQAIPRGDRMDLIVQKATELGVSEIAPLVATRSVSRPPAARGRRWHTIAAEAARQCGRADVPTVLDVRRLGEALAGEARLPARRFMLWEKAGEPSLRGAFASSDREAALLVGPEGGFTGEEVDLARAAGFLPVGLGPRILRVETAAIVAVALAQAALGALD